MQRRHCGKNVRSLGVQRFKYRRMKELVKFCEARAVAWSSSMKYKAMVRHIPGWRSGVKIINDEPDKIYQHKGE